MDVPADPLNLPGIYAITNIYDGTVYIGSTMETCLTRWHGHKARLRKHIHANVLLQEAVDVLSIDSFTFSVIETVTVTEILVERERYWVAHYKSQGIPLYNIAPIRRGHTYQFKVPKKRFMCICRYCGDDFPSYPSMHALYCSTKCYNYDQRKLISAMCEWCAQAFPTMPSRMEKGEGRFCSRKCGWASRQRQIEYPCAYCGNVFPDIASRANKSRIICCSRPCKESYKAREQLARFWDNVDQSGGPDACWPWLGGLNTSRGNYGKFHLCGKTYRAHRIAFILVNGPLLDEEEVMHRCDNPPCCNPGHLLKGTHLDNIRYMQAKDRHPTMYLTLAIAQEIYALKGQMSGIAAAGQYHTSRATVSLIWNKKVWIDIHKSLI